MKKMVCEICGSQSIRKENSIFVCTECGTEYSLEEARKLLKEVDESAPKKELVADTKDSKIKIASSSESKYDLLSELKCWLIIVSKLQNFYNWTGLRYQNNAEFWLNVENADKLSPNIKPVEYSLEEIVAKVFNGDSDPMIEQLLFEEYSEIKSGLLVDRNHLYKLWEDLAKNKLQGYKYGTVPIYFLTDEKGIRRPLKEFNYKDEDIESFIKFCIDNYLAKKDYKLIRTTYKDGIFHLKFFQLDDPRGQLMPYFKSTYEVFSTIKDMFENKVGEYNSKFGEAMKTFKEIYNESLELEKEFYLPYEYRDIKSLVSIISIIKDGRADTWKEAINLYKDDVFKSDVVMGLSQINNTINEINYYVKNGLQFIGQHLLNIENNLSNICDKLDESNYCLKNIMFDTRYKLIRDIISDPF